MKKAKRIMGILCLAILVSGIVGTANADLIIGDNFYVGSITPDVQPANPASEKTYIEKLITIAKGETFDDSAGVTGQFYSRIDSLLEVSELGAVGPFFTKFEDDPSNTFSILGAGNFYILGKYDAANAGALVWYVTQTDTTEYSIPASWSRFGLSHITIFGESAQVPEPTTLLLIGSGLLGLAAVRRKFRE